MNRKQLASLFTLFTVAAKLAVFAIVLGCLAPGSRAEAKVFSNAYVSFELPERWNCALEHTEWVCRPNDATGENRQAIIILTAKEVGPSDSLQSYERHLKTPRTIPSRSGQPLQSKMLKTEQRQIASHPWVDGMHESSEVPSYYTRYLATTKDKIAVLVTFSAHKTFYSLYSQDFFRAIESLRVIAMKASSRGSGANLPGGEIYGGSADIDMMSGSMDMPSEEGEGGGSDSATTFMGFALLIGAVGFYLLMKRKQSKGKDSGY